MFETTLTQLHSCWDTGTDLYSLWSPSYLNSYLSNLTSHPTHYIPTRTTEMTFCIPGTGLSAPWGPLVRTWPIFTPENVCGR